MHVELRHNTRHQHGSTLIITLKAFFYIYNWVIQLFQLRNTAWWFLCVSPVRPDKGVWSKRVQALVTMCLIARGCPTAPLTPTTTAAGCPSFRRSWIGPIRNWARAASTRPLSAFISPSWKLNWRTRAGSWVAVRSCQSNSRGNRERWGGSSRERRVPGTSAPAMLPTFRSWREIPHPADAAWAPWKPCCQCVKSNIIKHGSSTLDLSGAFWDPWS